VLGRNTNNDALMSTAIPIGNLLAILKAEIQNINRTAKGMGMWKSRASTFDTRKQFLG
jgi:hypothetical protein